MSLEIRPVASKRELMAFIKLPWRLYRNQPHWIPPLISERKKHLDRERNPFFRHARAEYFLAHREGRVVGRITAHVDFRFQEFQQNRWGWFGFLECEEDQAIATALLDTASGWLEAQGCERMVGPANFSTNHECGLLVEGFDRDPLILSDWHHPYLGGLIEGAGLTKAMDLLMWQLYIDDREKVHPAIWEMAKKSETEHGVLARGMDKKKLESEVNAFIEVYNEAWARNWGFVPLTDEEVRAYAKELRPVLDENWAFVATRDDEIIGAALTLPDYNQVLKHLNGRLLPIGWAKALYWRRKIDKVRVFALGVKRKHQHTGVAARFYEMHFDSAARTPQTGGEMGWILETNEPMNRAMEGMGGEVVRKYRLYERELEPADSVVADVA